MLKDLKEKDDILRATDGGLKVFQHYLGDKWKSRARLTPEGKQR